MDLPPGGEEVPAPSLLPEGWKALSYIYGSGRIAGQSYLRFFTAKHRGITSVRECISKDAEDRGLDPSAKLKEYDDIKRRERGLPDECFETFTPEMSGLDEAVLASLPADAPPGHAAWSKINFAYDKGGNKRAEFRLLGDDGRHDSMYITLAACCNNQYAMFRIARACCIKKENEGLDKPTTVKFRNGCYAKLKAQLGDTTPFQGVSGMSKDELTPSKRRKKADGEESANILTETEAVKAAEEPSLVKYEQPGASSADVSTTLTLMQNQVDDAAVKSNEPGAKAEEVSAEPTVVQNQIDNAALKSNEPGAKAEEVSAEPTPAPKKRRKEGDNGSGSMARGKNPAKSEVAPDLDNVPDAPPGHISHQLSLKWPGVDNRKVACHKYTAKKEDFPQFTKNMYYQLGLMKFDDNTEVALRVSRACYVMAECGYTEVEVKRYRDDCIIAWKALKTGNAEPFDNLKKLMQSGIEKRPEQTSKPSEAQKAVTPASSPSAAGKQQEQTSKTESGDAAKQELAKTSSGDAVKKETGKRALCVDCSAEGVTRPARTESWCHGKCQRHARAQGHVPPSKPGEEPVGKEELHDERVPSEKPSHWPPDVELGPSPWPSWLPNGWGHGLKKTNSGKTGRCYVSPEGRIFHHKSAIEQHLGIVLEDGKKGKKLKEWMRKQSVKVEQGDADKINASDSSSSSSSSGGSTGGSSSDSDDPPGDTKAAASAKAPPIAIRSVRGKACAKMMVRAGYRCISTFERIRPITNGRPLSGT